MSRQYVHEDTLGRRIARKAAVALVVLNVVGIGYLLTRGPDIAEATTAPAPPEKPKLPAEAAAVLHPIERIAYSDDWRRKTERRLKAGGDVFVILRTAEDSCAAVRSEAPGFRVFAMLPIEIDTPSSKGGKTGTFHEALVPRNDISCKTSRYVFAEWRAALSGPVEIAIGDQAVTVDVYVDGVLTPPKRPFYVALTNSYLIKGHCDKYCPREAELAHKYSRLLERHGIQPMQNWIGLPPVRNGVLDLDRRSKRNMSFRQTTMAYAKSGVVGFPRMDGYRDNIAYLRALEATIQREKLQGRAWVYAVDEPRVNAKLVEKLKMYRLFAPSAKIMVTTGFDPSLEDVVDIFAPVFNRYAKLNAKGRRAYENKKLWSYASCMGSCGPNRKSDIDVVKRPGADTKLADFLIDRPAARLFQFFEGLEKNRADGGLYYEATEGYPLARKDVDLFTDTWNFGGNGDGLLLFPGRPGRFGLRQHQPIASLRLKLIRHAIQNFW